MWPLQKCSGLPTSNIIGRVTGGETRASTDHSHADPATGFAIQSLPDQPAGWVFGATAVLDVGEVSHASTSHYVRFADGAQFFADPGRASVLASASPSRSDFSDDWAIVVDGSFLQVPRPDVVRGSGDVQIGGGAILSRPVASSRSLPRQVSERRWSERSVSNLGRIEMTGSTIA